MPAAVIAKPYRANRLGPHMLFCTLVAVAGTRLMLRLRDGDSGRIDATPAVANDDVPGPLAAGRLVAISGMLSRTGTLLALHVFRLNNLRHLPVDR